MRIFLDDLLFLLGLAWAVRRIQRPWLAILIGAVGGGILGESLSWFLLPLVGFHYGLSFPPVSRYAIELMAFWMCFWGGLKVLEKRGATQAKS